MWTVLQWYMTRDAFIGGLCFKIIKPTTMFKGGKHPRSNYAVFLGCDFLRLYFRCLETQHFKQDNLRASR